MKFNEYVGRVLQEVSDLDSEAGSITFRVVRGMESHHVTKSYVRTSFYHGADPCVAAKHLLHLYRVEENEEDVQDLMNEIDQSNGYEPE